MPRFNDDFYNRTVEDWENIVVRERARSDYLTWSLHLLPAYLVLGGVFAGDDWSRWVAILVGMLVLLPVLVLLEEINENVRYVRHQMRVFRDAIGRADHILATYKDPDRNFTAAEALRTINAEWESPTPERDELTASEGRT